MASKRAPQKVSKKLARSMMPAAPTKPMMPMPPGTERRMGMTGGKRKK